MLRLALVSSLLSLASAVGPATPHQRLHDALFAGYDRDVIPLEAANDTLGVNFGASMIWMNVNEEFALDAKIWGRFTWTDFRLKWDPKDFGGLSSVKVDTSKLWIPDIVLYNKG